MAASLDTNNTDWSMLFHICPIGSISYNWLYVVQFGELGGSRVHKRLLTYFEDILIITRLMSGKQQMKQLYVLFNKCINKWGTKGRVPKKTTKVWTYVQTGSTLPT